MIPLRIIPIPKRTGVVPVIVVLAIFSAPEVLYAQNGWLGSWAASQQRPEPQNSLATDDLRDATLRQVVHLTVGGRELRLHLSNRFGTAPMHIASVHIAQPRAGASGGIKAETNKPLTFNGTPDVTIPAGAEYVSDSITYPVAPLSDLAISIHFDMPPQDQTGHPGSRATSFLARGDLVAAADLPAETKRVEHWYFIAGIDVSAPQNAAAVVVVGDSITDGHGATTNGNDRWPDILARRLQSSTAQRSISVLNHGIGGNRLLLDGLGPNALARFNADVLAQAGVRFVIVLEGINDLGTLTRLAEVPPAEHKALVHNMIGAYKQIITRAHTHGIKVYGATILPFGGSGYYHPGPNNEADRQTVNKWIRAPGNFDSVIDFDKLTRDPEHPDRMLPAYDSGDHLHPGPAGYSAMGEAVPLSLFDLK